MFRLKTTPLQNSGVLNNLMQDYISQKENLRKFYEHFSDNNGFQNFLSENSYPDFDRDELTAILLKQSKEITSHGNVNRNIELLKHKNTYTVATGHQLCLFTGPLYFIYKIFSVINLAEKLNEQFPDKKFVPVYWAATEDHDFEEVNHFNAFGKQFEWTTEQSGAVGDFNTTNLQELFTSVKETFGGTDNGNHLVSLFENAYLKHQTLSEATRFLVNELFGNYGLITVDGNDPAFKKQFKAQFEKDIFENSAYKKVTESINELQTFGYSAQVNPREINCFYIETGLRARIEKENGKFKVIGTDKTFTPDEMHSLIENEPQKISPNVVLRPLYQQTILPNVAYVGGPGELAYWLQYKSMFNEFGIVFPVLTPRAFVSFIEKNVQSKIEKLGLEHEDIFKDEHDLIKVFQIRSNNVFDTNLEKEKLESIFETLAVKIAAVDKTLVNNVAAEKQKILNTLENISAKANRALKQRSDTEITQLKSIKEKLFPGKIPQERFENFSMYYMKWGKNFPEFLKSSIEPLRLEHSSIIEE